MEVATGIIGLVGVAASVSNQARAFFDGWSDAPSDVQLILNNVRDLEANLREIETLLKVSDASQSSLAAEEEERFRPVITDCSLTFEQLQGHMRKYDRVGSNKAKRTRWLLWGQKDYQRLGQRVECHKTTLILKLLLTRYAHASASNTVDIGDNGPEMMEQFRRLQASLSTSNPAIGQWLETATSYAETIHDGSEYAKSTTDEVPLVEDPTYAPQQIDIPPMAVQEIEALKESVQSVQKTITQSIQDLNKMSQSSQPAPTPFLSKDQVLSLMEKQFRWRQERTSIWPTYITPMNSGTSTNDWSKIIFADAGRNILKADGSVPGPLWNLSPKESKLSTYIYFHVISLLYLEAKMRERDNRFEWSFAGLTKHTDTRALTNSCYAVIYMRRSLKQDVTCDEKFMNEDTRHMRWQIPQKDEKTGKDLAVLKIDPQVKLACTVMPKQVLLAVQRQGLERRWDNDRSVKLKM